MRSRGSFFMRDELFRVFTAPLDTRGLRYMVVGSVASMVYGEPRLTNDIDLVLDLPFRRASEIPPLFPAESFYCPPEEVLSIESKRPRRGHFNLVHFESGYKADVYLCGEDPLQRWGLAQRRQVELAGGDKLWIAPPEYVILRKLEFFKEGGSEKHRLDVQGMLAASGDDLDRTFLREWVDKLGVREVWDSFSAGD